MKVPFLDLKVLDNPERSSLIKGFESLLDSGRLVMGKEIEHLEKEICEFMNTNKEVLNL